MDNKINYLVTSIQDIQATIRAIDTKIGILLVLMLFPLMNLPKVIKHSEHIISLIPSYCSYATIALFYLVWFLSVYIVVRAIGAIDNPVIHIKGGSEQLGTFYGGNLFTLGFTDSLFNKASCRSAKTIIEQYNIIPSETESIEKELVFEQIKLIYIRDVKINRLTWGLNLTYIWLLLGLIIYLISHYA